MLFYLQSGSNGYFNKNYNFQGFQGDQLFPGAVPVLITVENCKTCDFPGAGFGLPALFPSSLDPHMAYMYLCNVSRTNFGEKNE